MTHIHFGKYTIGTDPELFVGSGDTIVSAHDLIPGSKDHPFRVKSGAIQVDGVAAEFNTDPTDDRFVFLSNIREVEAQLLEIMSQRGDYFLLKQPTATFTQEYFDSLPEETKVLGCQPDFDAWRRCRNEPPETKEPFRTGAGHIHVGFTNVNDFFDPEYMDEVAKRVKQLDCVLYLASLTWDADKKRRSLYGRIGAFRPKFYGFEYRPLSNAYLKSDNIVLFVFDVTERAMQLYDQGLYLYELEEVKNAIHLVIEDCIEEADVRVLWEVLKKFGFPELPD